MWDNAKISATFSISLSGFLIIICVTIVAQLRLEIDSFYQEFMNEMKEFNVST